MINKFDLKFQFNNIFFFLNIAIDDSVIANGFEEDRDARHALFDAMLALTKTIGGVSRLREIKLVRT